MTLICRTRLSGILLALALSNTATISAAADAYPSRPITIVVPFGAGGGSDVLTRIVANKMSERLGQPIIVENKPGGSGILGTQQVVRAKPDGYTLVMAPSLLAISQASRKDPPYDLEKDMTPVGMLAQTPFVLVARADLPAKTLNEYIASAKASPGKHTFGSSGEGALAHLAMEVLKKSTNTDILHVPFKTEPQAITEVVAGRVDVMFASMSTALPFIQSGKVRALAVGTPNRVSLMPTVPTTAESGHAGVTALSWYGFLAPKNVPDDVIRKLNAELRIALDSPVVRERMVSLGAEPMDSSVEAAKSVIAAELKRWRTVVAALGLQL